MDAGEASDSTVFQGVSRFEIRPPPVDESVDNLCCI